MSNIELAVNKRAHDIHVSLVGNPAVWACGKTVAEAIGSFVQTHGADLGITVSYPATLTDGVPDPGSGQLSEDELFAFANERQVGP